MRGANSAKTTATTVAGRIHDWSRYAMRKAPSTVPTKASIDISMFLRYSICVRVVHVEPMLRKNEPTLILPTTEPNVMPGNIHCMSGTEKNIPPPKTTPKTPTTKPPTIKISEPELVRKLSDDSSTVVFHFPADNRVDRFAAQFLADECRVLALGEELLFVHNPIFCRIKNRDISIRSLRKVPLVDADDARRCGRHFLDALLERNVFRLYEIRVHDREACLKSHGAEGRVLERLQFFRVDVLLRAQRRVHLGVGVVAHALFVGEREMLDRDFRGDIFCTALFRFADGAYRARGRIVHQVESRTGFLGEQNVFVHSHVFGECRTSREP